MSWKLLMLVLLVIPQVANAKGKDKDNGRPPCATTFSVIQEDTLGNVLQGLSKPKNLKWVDKDLQKNYPDVCYVAPSPSVKTVFYITVTPDIYHGTSVQTTTHTAPTSGTITDSNGSQQIGTYQGTSTSTSSVAVPYSFEYGRYMLTVETFGADGKSVARRRFQQNGIYRTMYGIPLGGRGHHPIKALVEDAVKWIHAGGLDDPLQTIR